MQGGLLDRIWVRLGLCIAGTLLATMGLLAGSVLAFSELRYQDFFRSLPAQVQEELSALNDNDEENSPRAMAIYSQYWRGDLLFSEKLSLLVGLVVCLPFGLAVGFWVSRLVTLPLASLSEAATRVAQGDLTVRAQDVAGKGEMAEMVLHFNQMVDGLEDMARERRATAAAISHELRTPLTVLRARLHAICDGVIEADAAESRALLEQVEYLGRLVGDLHTLSMAEAGQLSVQLQRQDLGQLVREALAAHADRIADHGMRLEQSLPPASQVTMVQVDADRVRQILFNLVENALRHARSGGWIGVAIETVGPDVALQVRDAGPGLSKDMLERPFRRFAHAPDERKEGSGLGLSIVQALALRQGGRVEVTNRPQGGTCFSVLFPRAPA
jgi:signal transduction histidine kinase